MKYLALACNCHLSVKWDYVEFGAWPRPKQTKGNQQRHCSLLALVPVQSKLIASLAKDAHRR
jgi:hypothetical protein